MIIISILFPESQSAHAATLTIPQDQPIVIVTGDRPTVTEKFAATELQSYLLQMRGGEVSISTVDRDGFPIYLGNQPETASYRDQLTDPIRETQEEVFILEIKRDSIFAVGGGDRGTLYATYALLEELGCLWMEPGPDGEYVPELSSLELELGKEFQRPAMTVRHLGTSGQLPDPLNKRPDEIEKTIDWMVKNRLNMSFSLRPQVLYQKMPRDRRNLWTIRGGMIEWQHIVHNLPFIFPNEVYFEEHPEYYALYKGRRIPAGPEMGNPALTNPDVRRIAAEFAANWFDRHPNGSVVPLVPPDGAVKWDESPEAMALGGRNFVKGPEGSMSRRMAEFSAAVAEQLQDAYPDRYILNLAYSNYVEPFPELALPENVITQVAHGYAGQGSFIHSIYSDRNIEAREIFEAWANSGAGGIGIWDYFLLHVPTQAGSAKTPLGLGNVARDMISYLRDLKPEYKVYFTQTGNEHWQYNAFLYWAVAQLTWNPDTSIEELAEVWSKAAFGESWESAYNYHLALEEAYDNEEWQVGIWREINVPSALVFTDSFFEKVQPELEILDSTVDPSNQIGTDLIRRMQTSISLAEESVRPQKLFGPNGEWTLERGNEFYELNASGSDTIDEEELLALIGGESQDQTVKHMKFRAHKRKEPIVWIESESLKVGIIPGIGGRIIRLIDKATGQNLMYEPEISSLRIPGAPYFRYGGYEEYIGNAFASPGWETAMSIINQTSQSLAVEADIDGLIIQRSYALDERDPTKLNIYSKITNRSQENREARIRIHPEFKLDPRLDDTTLLLKGADGEYSVESLFNSDAVEDFHTGSWAVVSPELNLALINNFPTDSVETAHLHLDTAVHSFNLELFGTPTVLAPGESIALSHSYRVVEADVAREVLEIEEEFHKESTNNPDWISSEEESHPVESPLNIPVYSSGDTPLILKRIPERIGELATLTCLFRLDQEPEEIPDAVFFSFGTKTTDWMIVRISKGYLYVYRTHGEAPFTSPSDAWAKLQVPVEKSIKPNRWYNLAVSWDGRDGPDYSTMSVMLDGKVLDERSNLTIYPATSAEALVIGGNSQAISRRNFPGDIDNVRIYLATPKEVRKRGTPPLVNLTARP